MDYKEQIDQAKRAAEKWKEETPIVGVGRLRVDLMVDDLTRSITDLLARAEAAEARVRELETSFRTEKCENGPECVELGRVRKALAEAEAQAEKAERERDVAVADLRLVSDCRTCGNVTPWCIDNPDKCKGWKWRGKKEE